MSHLNPGHVLFGPYVGDACMTPCCGAVPFRAVLCCVVSCRAVCCRVLVMDKGKALEYGRPADLLEVEGGAFAGAHAYVLLLLCAVQWLAAKQWCIVSTLPGSKRPVCCSCLL
jgi:hypothetical protein